MHRYLVEHGWINDYTGKPSLVMSYLAFLFIPPCFFMAYCEWLLSAGTWGMAVAVVAGVVLLVFGLVSLGIFPGWTGIVDIGISLFIFIWATAVRVSTQRGG